MPPLSSKRLRQHSSNKALRELVNELAAERRSRSKLTAETAFSMRTRSFGKLVARVCQIFNMVQCPENLRVDQAAFYVQEEADY